MKKKLCAVLLMVCVGLVGAATTATASADTRFHLEGSGSLNFGGGTQSGTVLGTQVGNGDVSGHFTLTGPVPLCSSDSTVINTVASQTITAADGSAFTQSLIGVTCGLSPTSFRTTSTYNILSGTGRFSSATGTGSHVRFIDFPNGTSSPGTWTMAQDGTINLNK
jgi:hypothetical protein